MSYFQRACDYYILQVNLQGDSGKQEIIRRCKAKYARGINVVAVTATQLKHTFTPHFLVDPGRIFLTYERLVENVQGLDEEVLAEAKKQIEGYNPDDTLLYLLVTIGKTPWHGVRFASVHVESPAVPKEEKKTTSVGLTEQGAATHWSDPHKLAEHLSAGAAGGRWFTVQFPNKWNWVSGDHNPVSTCLAKMLLHCCLTACTSKHPRRVLVCAPYQRSQDQVTRRLREVWRAERENKRPLGLDGCVHTMTDRCFSVGAPRASADTKAAVACQVDFCALATMDHPCSPPS